MNFNFLGEIMKRYIIAAAVSLPVILVSLFILNFTAGDNKNHRHDQEENNYAAEKTSETEMKNHSCCSSEEEEGEFSENSIYQLESDLPAGKAGWTTQTGEKFSLGELKGSPVVLTMFFASCTYACPILVNDMKKIENEIPKEELLSYKFVLVSIDPERDTPEKLQKFADDKNLDTKRWTLLTGSSDDIMELAALIGFKYKKDKNGDFSHSNLITFLNREGEIQHQQFGLNQDASESAKILLSKN
jgi:protein SCO1/2